MHQEIQKTLSQIIEKKFNLKIDTFRLENPPKKELGDIAFPCFQLAKDTKLAPPVIATQLKEFIESHKSEYGEIEKLEIAGPYLNITLNKAIYTKQFLDVFTDSTNAFSFPQRDELVIVDYIGANVGKPLHIGHMCTPNIGQTLVNLYIKLGYKVIGDSHIGDWGIIFGKLIYGINFNAKLSPGGEEDVRKKIKEAGIEYLLLIYQQVTNLTINDSISEEARKQAEQVESDCRLEFQYLSGTGIDLSNPNELAHHQKNIELWKEITSMSIDFMQKQLDRLGVKPDYHVGESFYEGLPIPKMGNYPDLKYPMKVIVEELIEKGIAKRNDDGSAGVEFEKLPSTILQKRDGTHGYLASDLATIKYRVDNSNNQIIDANGIDWSNLVKIIYSVDVRQELHLQQVFDIAYRAGWIAGGKHTHNGVETSRKLNIELFHASNGFISLKDGAMSTRTGKIIRLETLLDQAQSRAEKIILEKRPDLNDEKNKGELNELAKKIGIGAIKYGYLSKSRTTNVVFDWDEFMTFEGNSGPYIQYAYVRGKSILSQLGYQDSGLDIHSLGLFESSEEIELVKGLLNYKNILQETAEKNFPHVLTGYIYELTKQFNSFYNAVHIKNEPDEGKKQLRLMLVSIFCETIKDGFGVLAIEVPEKM